MSSTKTVLPSSSIRGMAVALSGQKRGFEGSRRITGSLGLLVA